MPETTDRALCVSIDGPVRKENFALTKLHCDEMLKRHNDIRLLILCRNFAGWSEETSRLDMSFSLEYGTKMSRLALVNPPASLISLFKFKEVLHKREVRYYDADGLDEALAWINE